MSYQKTTKSKIKINMEIQVNVRDAEQAKEHTRGFKEGEIRVLELAPACCLVVSSCQARGLAILALQRVPVAVPSRAGGRHVPLHRACAPWGATHRAMAHTTTGTTGALAPHGPHGRHGPAPDGPCAWVVLIQVFVLVRVGEVVSKPGPRLVPGPANYGSGDTNLVHSKAPEKWRGRKEAEGNKIQCGKSKIDWERSNVYLKWKGNQCGLDKEGLKKGSPLAIKNIIPNWSEWKLWVWS